MVNDFIGRNYFIFSYQPFNYLSFIQFRKHQGLMRITFYISFKDIVLKKERKGKINLSNRLVAFTFARRLTFLCCHGDSSFKLRKITTISGLNLHKLSRKFTVGGLEHIFSIFILFWGGSKELRPQRPVRRTSSGDKTISHPPPMHATG